VPGLLFQSRSHACRLGRVWCSSPWVATAARAGRCASGQARGRPLLEWFVNWYERRTAFVPALRCRALDLQEQFPSIHPEQYQPIAEQNRRTLKKWFQPCARELEEIRT